MRHQEVLLVLLFVGVFTLCCLTPPAFAGYSTLSFEGDQTEQREELKRQTVSELTKVSDTSTQADLCEIEAVDQNSSSAADCGGIKDQVCQNLGH